MKERDSREVRSNKRLTLNMLALFHVMFFLVSNSRRHNRSLFYWSSDICFFFSSRRRHTRSLCDWSSDVCFFFSSRRRHTRSLCDWSSDVCSSDLKQKTAYEITV